MRLQDADSERPENAPPADANVVAERRDEERVWLERIVDTQRAIAEAGLDLDAVARVVCERARAWTEADGSALLLAEDEQTLRCVAATGLVAATLGSPVPIHASASGWTYLHGGPLIINDAESDPRIGPDFVRRYGARAGIAMPLFHGDAGVGVVVVHSRRVNAFSEDDARRLDLLSVLLSAAMSNAAAFEAKRNQVETLGRFRKIFDGAPIGLIRLDGHGRVVEANPAMEQLLGYTAEELKHLGVEDITDPRDLQHCIDLYGEIVSGTRDSYEIEKRYVRKDGELLWACARATVLERDEHGRPEFAILMVEDISERKLAELTLRENSELSQLVASLRQFQLIFDNLPTGLARLDANGRVIEANTAFERGTGFPSGDLPGHRFANLVHPDERDDAAQTFREVIDGERDSYTAERRYVRHDGKTIWCHVSVTAFEREPDGTARSAVVMAEDITKRKRAELALREKTEQLSRIVDTQRAVAAADLDLASVMTLICERTQELTGGDGASILILEGDDLVYRAASGFLTTQIGVRSPLGQTFPGWIHESKKAGITHDTIADPRASDRAAELGIRSAVAVPLRHGEHDVGQLHVVSHQPNAFTEDDVQTLDLLSVVLSAAMSHAAEFEAKRQQLGALTRVRENAERLERIVETQRAIAEAGLDLHEVMRLIAERAQALTHSHGAAVNLIEGDDVVTLAATGAALKMLGVRRPLSRSTTGHAAKLGRALLIERVEDDPRISPAIASITGQRSQICVPLFKEGQVVASITVLKTSDEDRLTEDDRQTLELLGVVLASAVSAAAEFEAKRQQVEALKQLEVVWKNSPVGIQIVTLDGRVVSANPAMLAIYGWTLEELAEQHMSSYLHPDDIDTVVSHVRALVKGAYEGDTCKMDARFFQKDGGVVATTSSVSVVRDAIGVPQFFVGMVEDVTGQKAAEERLRQSQKIEAIGQLSAGIAHDFNNLLMGVLGYVGLARGQVERDTQLDAYLARIEDTGHRAASLTKQLLAFGRRQTLQLRELDLNELVSETLALLGRLLGEHIEIVSSLPAGLPVVPADPTQIQQVLLNLALNARDAMPGGGMLTIETASETLVESPAGLELNPGSYVVLTVSDTGRGMPPEVVERIFEPFFTTKDVGEGSGLGLPSVHGIVKQSRGDIDVKSIVGVGTTVRIYLPAPELAVERAVEPAELAAAG